jgi:hypothetical protein
MIELALSIAAFLFLAWVAFFVLAAIGGVWDFFATINAPTEAEKAQARSDKFKEDERAYWAECKRQDAARGM